MKNGESFFSRLESFRGSRTKAEFARVIGVSPPLYQKWASGSIPGGDKLDSISRVTGKSIGWLLTGRESVEEIRKDFRDRLIEARVALRSTLMDLARNMEVETSALQSIMDRKSEPTLALVDAFEKHIQPLIEARCASPPASTSSQGVDVATLRHELAPMLERLSAIERLLVKLTSQ